LPLFISIDPFFLRATTKEAYILDGVWLLWLLLLLLLLLRLLSFVKPPRFVPFLRQPFFHFMLLFRNLNILPSRWSLDLASFSPCSRSRLVMIPGLDC
jgi:hypothetical protein